MSHLVAILTINEKDSLVGQKYDSVSYFNPIEDCNDNWIISKEEIDGNIYSEFDWLYDLTLSDYCPKPVPPITGDTGDFLGS